jgi:hypothetical protein
VSPDADTASGAAEFELAFRFGKATTPNTKVCNFKKNYIYKLQKSTKKMHLLYVCTQEGLTLSNISAAVNGAKASNDLNT